MRETSWTKLVDWPGYRGYQQEIDEKGKSLKLWVRRKRGKRRLVCSGCGRRLAENSIHEVLEPAAKQQEKTVAWRHH